MALLISPSFVALSLAAVLAAPVAQDLQTSKPDAKADKVVMLRAPGIEQPFSQADVDFMQGMIPHHAQAVKMGGWAPTRGSNKQLLVLCERIVVGQSDEIKLMQQWLSDRGQEVPAADAMRHKMKMGDMVHEMLMPGMMTDEEMAALEKARGKEWDRLFLIGMIKHHEGAIKMVEELMNTTGGATGDDMFKFASDVFADQSTEIEVMKQMLAAIKGE